MNENTSTALLHHQMIFDIEIYQAMDDGPDLVLAVHAGVDVQYAPAEAIASRDGLAVATMETFEDEPVGIDAAHIKIDGIVNPERNVEGRYGYWVLRFRS